MTRRGIKREVRETATERTTFEGEEREGRRRETASASFIEGLSREEKRRERLATTDFSSA